MIKEKIFSFTWESFKYGYDDAVYIQQLLCNRKFTCLSYHVS